MEKLKTRKLGNVDQAEKMVYVYSKQLHGLY
jgi:hypothetical protein